MGKNPPGERSGAPGTPRSKAALALLWLVFLTTRILVFTFCDQATGDVKVYFDQAQRALSGENPYAEEPFGYPPLTLAYVTLPALVSGPAPGLYYQAFRGQAYLVDLLIFSLLLTWSRRGAGPLAYTLSTFLLGNLLYHRVDLALGALLLGAFGLYRSGKKRPAFALLGVATAFKVIPVVILPAALVWEYRRSPRAAVRGALWLLLGASVPTALGLLLYGPESLIFLSNQARRGVQVESLWATVSWLLILAGERGHVYWAGGAFHLHTSYETVFSLFAKGSVLLVAAFSAYRAWRTSSPSRDPLTLWLFSLLAAVTLSPVLSPQFLLFLAPLVALVGEGEPHREVGHGGDGGEGADFALLGLFGLASLFTTVVYPFQEEALNLLLTRAELPLLLRNLSLLVVSGWLLWRVEASGRPRGG